MLSARERQALTAFADTDPDFGYLSFQSVAERSGLAQHQVRRAVRALARKGMTVYGRGLWTDEGEPAGSGYALTPAGRTALQEATDGEC